MIDPEDQNDTLGCLSNDTKWRCRRQVSVACNNSCFDVAEHLAVESRAVLSLCSLHIINGASISLYECMGVAFLQL